MVQILSLLAANEKTAGKILNAGNDREISIGDLAKIVQKISKSSSKIKFIEYAEAYGRPFKDVDHRRPDLTELRKWVSFTHKWELEDTLDDLVAIEAKKQQIRIPAE